MLDLLLVAIAMAAVLLPNVVGFLLLSFSQKSQNNQIIKICIGEESFEHANVLSEKINFSALGGPRSAIFGPDNLHPIY